MKHVKILSEFGDGLLASGEDHFFTGRAAAWEGGVRPKVILYLHGGGETVVGVASASTHQALFFAAGRASFVACGEWGGTYAFGNPASVESVVSGLAAIRAQRHVDPGPVGILAGSMGWALGCAFAKAYPNEVAAMAGIIPLCDLQDVETNNRSGQAANLDLAYGGEYDNAVHGPDYNPVLIAPTLDPSLPQAIWSSSNDSVTPPSTVQAYLAARPQTEHYNLGAVGHGPDSLNGDPALWPDGAQGAITSWLLAHI